jgi:hypothetical protein
MIQEFREGLKNNPVWFSAIGAVTLVQGWFAWEFWGAVTDDALHQAALRTMGLGFVAAEVVALDMASRRALKSDKVAANTLRAMWVGLALTNFAADVNALSRVLESNEAPRAAIAAQQDARAMRIRELDELIAGAREPDGDPLLTVNAYTPLLESKDREVALSTRSPRWVQRRLEEERGQLAAAQETARQVEGWRAERARLRAAEAEAAPQAQTGALEFEPLARSLTGAVQGLERGFGDVTRETQITGEDVRNGMAVAASLLMKALLTFGLFVGLERARQPAAAPKPAAQEPPPTHRQGPPVERPLPAPQRRRATATAQPVRRFGRGGELR